MKKLITFLIAAVVCFASYGQKPSAMTETTWKLSTHKIYIWNGIAGQNVKLISVANLMDSLTLSGLISLPATTSIGTVSATEIGYIDNLASSAQSQLNAKTNNVDTSGMLNKYARKASPTLTGVPKIGTDTIATRAYARGYGGTGSVNAADTSAMLADYINKADTASMLSDYINKIDTATMLDPYITDIEARAAINDSLDSYIAGAEVAVSFADSGVYNGGYMTPRGTDIKLALKANLASPTFTGTVVLPSPFTLGATSVTANGAELNVLDNIPATLTSTELGYVDGVTSAIQTQFAAKQNIIPDTVAYTSNSTLALTDANKIIMATKATSIVLTIPANSTAAIPVGTTINFVQTGAGIIVFKEAAGVNLYSKKDSIATGGIRSWAALYKRGTNNWILYGDILD